MTVKYSADLPEDTAPPTNKMGVTVAIAHSVTIPLIMNQSGKPKYFAMRQPGNGQICTTDYLNMSIDVSTWSRTARESLVTDEQHVHEASRHCEMLFGFGVTACRNKGMNFYRESYILGDNFGFVCVGGQKETMLITLTGLGCTNAVEGWEKRVYQFVTKGDAIRPALTRIDLAYDDFEGDHISVDWAEEQWHVGGYTAITGGVPPTIERRGDWHRPNGKGRTLYIGRRESGKFCRVYEKGKSEGCATSNWTRFEVEFKNKDRDIPFEILLDPSSYFVSAYPCISEFAHAETPKRIAVKQKTAQINVDAIASITKHQFGKHLRVLRELHGDAGSLNLICSTEDDYWPKRLKPITASISTAAPPIHTLQDEVFVPTYIDYITTLPSHGLNKENGFPKQSNRKETPCK